MGGLDLGTIGTTISGALLALGVISTFLSRESRRQRAQNRRLRNLVLDYDGYCYDIERAARARGVRLPPKPRSLQEAHDDQPDDDPADPSLDGPDPSTAVGSRHALRDR